MRTEEITIVTLLNPLDAAEGNVRLNGREIVQHFAMWQLLLLERIIELTARVTELTVALQQNKE